LKHSGEGVVEDIIEDIIEGEDGITVSMIGTHGTSLVDYVKMDVLI
jgi:hypothetical protein